VPVPDCEGDGVAVLVPVAVPDCDGEGVPVPVPELEGDGEAVPDCEGEGEPVPVCVGDGVPLTNTPATRTVVPLRTCAVEPTLTNGTCWPSCVLSLNLA
jgi:hypothetical protein